MTIEELEEHVKPNCVYNISHLSYYADIPYETMRWNIQKGFLKAGKSEGSRIWRILGKDFYDWYPVKITNELNRDMGNKGK